METGAFLKSGIKPDFATQSGPMLVIDGKLHPKFGPQSTSFKKRNGVGMIDKDMVVFAISESGVTFHTFARFFRDELGADNALFLDGSISSLHYGDRSDGFFPLGPIVCGEQASVKAAQQALQIFARSIRGMSAALDRDRSISRISRALRTAISDGSISRSGPMSFALRRHGASERIAIIATGFAFTAIGALVAHALLLHLLHHLLGHTLGALAELA